MHDYGVPDIGLTGAAFWLAIAAVVVAAIVMNGLRRREELRTVQRALEKGQNLDPALLEKLLAVGKPPEPQPEGYYIGGVIMVAIGLGLAALGYFASPNRGEWTGMMGVSILVVLFGVGIALGGPITAAANRRRQQRGGPGGA